MRRIKYYSEFLVFVLWSAYVAIPGRCQERLAHFDGVSLDRLAPCANLGDIDGDGVGDVILGLPLGGTSRVWVYSGRTLTRLYEIAGTSSCCHSFGWSVAGAGDFDADGVPDFVVGDEGYGNFTHQGAVHVFSGASGTQLAVMYGQLQDEALGRQVAGLGDVDGDGFADIGAPNYFNHVRIFGGPDGHLVRSHFGPTLTRPWIAGVGDLDDDGRPDYGIGWPQDSTTATWAGRVTVYSGASGSSIRDVFGQTGASGAINGDHLGTSVAGVGDMDTDGLPDFAAGAPGSVCLCCCGSATQAMVRVYSGSDSTILHEWHGNRETSKPTGGRFGHRVHSGGDLNADGVPDLLIAAPLDGPATSGSIQAFSGRSGAKLWRVGGEKVDSRLVDAAILGDLDGDGLAEFAVGDAHADHGGPFAGRVTLYRGFAADLELHCRPAQHSQGLSIQLDAAGPLGIGNNALRLVATQALPSQPALFFYGPPRAPQSFGDGHLCSGPPVLRLGPPGTVSSTGMLERALDFLAPPMSTGPGRITPGSTWSFQLFCRDPASPGSGFNFSSGLAITFPP